MTRDEAIALSIQHRAGDANRTPNQIKSLQVNAARRIDSYVALGMLKLDEPATLADRIKGALKWGDNSYSMAMAMLNDAGLKIVEK